MDPSIKWGHHGELLTPREAVFVDEYDVDPGFNDFNSNQMLEAYRAGYRDATQSVGVGRLDPGERSAVLMSIAREIVEDMMGEGEWRFTNDLVKMAMADDGDVIRGVK